MISRKCGKRSRAELTKADFPIPEGPDDDHQLGATLLGVVGRGDDVLDLGRATYEGPGRLASPITRCPGHAHTAASVERRPATHHLSVHGHKHLVNRQR